MAWRLALSLVGLRAEFDRAFPTRSKRSDGAKGDDAHAARASRHNPNRWEVVTALDITHDPASGCDVHDEARQIVERVKRDEGNPDLEYVISNGEIAKRSTGFRWEPYRRSNKHRTHAHFAVGRGPDRDPRPPYDSTAPWGVADIEEDEMTLSRGNKGPAVKLIQTCLINEAQASGRSNGNPLPIWGADGKFGTETEDAVKDYQHGAFKTDTPSGKVDGVTAAFLLRYGP